MSREEEKIKAANNYCIDARLGYPRVMDDTDKLIFKAYLEGVNWADQHPRKGLWDAEKVIEWLENHVREFKYYDSDCTDGIIDVEGLIETLTKTMED